MSLEDIKNLTVTEEVHFIGEDGCRYTLKELIGKEENVKNIPTRDYGGLFANLPRSEPVPEDTSGELPFSAGGDSE